jgi:hypothetical protein
MKYMRMNSVAGYNLEERARIIPKIDNPSPLIPVGLENFQGFTWRKKQPDPDNEEIGTQVKQAEPGSVHRVNLLLCAQSCGLIGSPKSLSGEI